MSAGEVFLHSLRIERRLAGGLTRFDDLGAAILSLELLASSSDRGECLVQKDLEGRQFLVDVVLGLRLDLRSSFLRVVDDPFCIPVRSMDDLGTRQETIAVLLRLLDDPFGFLTGSSKQLIAIAGHPSRLSDLVRNRLFQLSQ